MATVIEDGKAKSEQLKRLEKLTPMQELLKKAGGFFKKGDPEAQFELGFRYTTGEGVPSNIRKGWDWYEKAAKQGHAEAQYQMAVRYEHINSKLATEWRIKAAEQGHSEAQNLLGKEADRIMERSDYTIQGNYSRLFDGEKDLLKRIYPCICKSAERGEAWGQYRLGRLLDGGLAGQELGITKDVKQAIKLYRMAAMQGNADAQCSLGEMLGWGIGVERDLSEATEWLRKSEAQGNINAMSALGTFLGPDYHYVPPTKPAKPAPTLTARSNGEKKVTKENAVLSFKKEGTSHQASENDSDESDLSDDSNNSDDEKESKAGEIEAVTNSNGKSVESNRLKSLPISELVKKAGIFTKGDPAAQFELGRRYMEGCGVPCDIVRGQGWFKKAAEFYIKAAVKGDALAQFRLGEMFEKGLGGMRRDLNQAMKWFKQSAEQGYDEAQYKIATIFEDGRVGEKDERLAVEWYRKAVKQGHKAAKARLNIVTHWGAWYRESDSRSDSDDSDDSDDFDGTDKLDENSKKRAMGRMYEMGTGFHAKGLEHESEKDTKSIIRKAKWYSKAIECYGVAAELGHAEAQYRLAQLLKQGRGAAKDEEQAAEWFKKAAEQGCDKSKMKSPPEVPYDSDDEALGVYETSSEDDDSDDEKSRCSNPLSAAQQQDGFSTKETIKTSRSSVTSFSMSQTTAPKKEDATILGAIASPQPSPLRQLIPQMDRRKPSPPKRSPSPKVHFHFGLKEILHKPNSTFEQPKKEPQRTQAATPATESLTEVKAGKEISMLNSEQLKFITLLQALLTPEVLRQLRLLSEQEFGTFQDWVQKVNHLETIIVEAQRKLALDTDSKQEQDYINANPKLQNYQHRLESELNRFILCYFLAPAGILKLDDNKKDLVISAIGGIPIAGQFLKVLTSSLSMANKKYRFYQVNRLCELFKSVEEISSVIRAFARKLTLAKEKSIMLEQEIRYEGIDKLKGYYLRVKQTLEHQWKDLAKSDKTGVSLTVEDKLAVLDCAYLLQQILSGKAHIDKGKDISTQLVSIVTGVPYKPWALTNSTSTPAVAPSSGSTLLPPPSRIFCSVSVASVSSVSIQKSVSGQSQNIDAVSDELEALKRKLSEQEELAKERDRSAKVREQTFKEDFKSQQAAFETYKKEQEEAAKRHEEFLRAQREEFERHKREQGKKDQAHEEDMRRQRDETKAAKAEAQGVAEDLAKMKKHLHKIKPMVVDGDIQSLAFADPETHNAGRTTAVETSKILSQQAEQINVLTEELRVMKEKMHLVEANARKQDGAAGKNERGKSGARRLRLSQFEASAEKRKKEAMEAARARERSSARRRTAIDTLV